MNQLPVKIENCEPSEVGLDIPKAISIQQWKEIGHTLCRCQGALQWWIGDWINYGEEVYGEKYAEAIRAFGAEALGAYGYSPETLRVYSSVARRVVVRDNKLTWTHHKIVAEMPERDQKKWLKRASENKWDTKKLKSEINRTSADPLAGVSHEVKADFDTRINAVKTWFASQDDLTEWPIERIESVEHHIKSGIETLTEIKSRLESERTNRLTSA